MNAYPVQVRKEVIVMDADGSKSGDDSSVPLIFSEMQSIRGGLTRAHLHGHFLISSCRA
jgi:hypothetical protein